MDTHPLVSLLSPDILQPSIQIADLARHILNLALVGTLNGARLTNGHVELKLDVSGRRAARQPPLGRGHVGRREADAVVARVGSTKSEAPLGSALLAHDAVVIVEDFVDADVDSHVVVGVVAAAMLVPLFGFIVAW